MRENIGDSHQQGKPALGRVEMLVSQAAEREAIRFQEQFDAVRQYCESPIEELLLAALFSDHSIHEFDVIFMGDCEPSLVHATGETVYIYQQAKVGDYRTDFLVLDASIPFEVSAPRWMVVECDGHDYHERTKEQARRDKRRDRFFQSQGYKVLRFTGSEIWADAEACADEILGELARDDSRRSRLQ